MNQKILLLLKGFNPATTDLIKQASDFLIPWSAKATNEGFQWNFATQVTTASYFTTTGPVLMGDKVVQYSYVDPKSIAAQDSQGCKIVMLLYEANLFPNTVSIELPYSKDGVTFCALPISKDANIPGISQNIAHELLHAEYFLANQTGAHLVDDVHQHSGIDDPRPQANYSDILLKLKPYWPLLASQPQQPDKSILAFTIATLQKQLLDLLIKFRDSLLAQVKKKNQ
jgi:hypothetical protein